jgi:hypothetical protein
VGGSWRRTDAPESNEQSGDDGIQSEVSNRVAGVCGRQFNRKRENVEGQTWSLVRSLSPARVWNILYVDARATGVRSKEFHDLSVACVKT